MFDANSGSNSEKSVLSGYSNQGGGDGDIRNLLPFRTYYNFAFWTSSITIVYSN